MAFCSKCGAQMEDNNVFCSACGANVNEMIDNKEETIPTVQENQFFENAQSVVQPKKKSKAPLIIIAVVALIAAVVGVLFATGTFDKVLKDAGIISSPANEIFDAAKTTVFESQSLTVEVDDGYDNSKVQISFGDGVKGLKVYAEEDGEGMLGIYDGISYEYHSGTRNIEETLYPNIENTADTLDVEGADELDKLFNGKLNESVVKDIYNVGLRDGIENYLKIMYLQGLSEEEMMQYYKQTEQGYTLDYENIPVSVDLPDYDALMGATDEFLKNGLTEEAITFEKDGDSYEFTIDASEFLECLADFVGENETMKSLIEAYYEVTKVVDTLEGDTDSEKIDIQKELRMLADECREENIKFDCEATIEDGYLTYLKAEYDDETFEIKVSNIGSTTVDKADVEAIDTVDPYAEEYDDYYGDDYYYEYY